MVGPFRGRRVLERVAHVAHVDVWQSSRHQRVNVVVRKPDMRMCGEWLEFQGVHIANMFNQKHFKIIYTGNVQIT